MAVRLKSLSDQVIVITGASSGIGLTTARMAAERGARVVLAARDEGALRRVTDDIGRRGGEAVHVVADVGRIEDVHRIAEAAVERFGGFDTWVNNAGVSIYGTIEQIPLEEQRRLFDTDYWGVVHGSRVAVEHLRKRGGGALINVGSVLSERAVPYQGPYCAAKHAVKGFTDALRMELEADGLPIAVTLIKPGSIDTPFPEHAKNYLPEQPRVPPPVYAPELVARAILSAAERPVRDLYVGGGGRLIAAADRLAPRLTDYAMERTGLRSQQSGWPAGDRGRNSLYGPSQGGRQRGSQSYYTRERSAYTAMELHPVVTATAAAALGAALATLLWSRGANGGAAPPPRRRRRPAAPPGGVRPETLGAAGRDPEWRERGDAPMG